MSNTKSLAIEHRRPMDVLSFSISLSLLLEIASNSFSCVTSIEHIHSNHTEEKKQRSIEMNRLIFDIKQDPDALDLTNRSQHLLSPSLENDDDDDDEDDDEEYMQSEDDQHNDQLPDTNEFAVQVRYPSLVVMNDLVLSARRQPMTVASSIRAMRTTSWPWSNKVGHC